MTVLLLQPQPMVSDGEVRRLLAWIRSGGVLVAAARSDLSTLLASAGASTFSTPPEPVTVVEPILGRPPASGLQVRASSSLTHTRGVAVAGSREGPVLVRVPFGKGVLWLISVPQALDNAHLDRSGNRALLLSLAGTRGRTVAFAALPFPPGHHAATSLFALPWGIAILFGLSVVLIYRWLGGWRLGPPIPEPEFNIRPAVDYVIAIASLLRKARRQTEVLRLYQDRLRRLSETGYTRVEVPEQMLEQLGKVDDVELVARSHAIVSFEAGVRGGGDRTGD